MNLFLTAIGLGIAFCAIPGTITTQVLRRGLESGFRAALSLQIGALVGIVFWASLALMGAAVLVQITIVRLLLGVLGILLLLRLMVQAFRTAYDGTSTSVPASKGQSDFVLGAALSLASPGAIAFWLGIGATILPSGKAAATVLTSILFLSGFVIGAILWSVFLAGVVAWGIVFVTPRFFRVINLLCGVVLGFFALRLLWTTLHLLSS